MQVRLGALALFINHRAATEPVETEARCFRMRFVARAERHADPIGQALFRRVEDLRRQRCVADVRGKRGEEVYVILDQYMNDALLLGVPEVRILHGKGDGILRNLVKEQLKRYREVKLVQDEHADRGGAGISIVTFK